MIIHLQVRDYRGKPYELTGTEEEIQEKIDVVKRELRCTITDEMYKKGISDVYLMWVGDAASAVFSRRNAAKEAGLDEETSWTDIISHWRHEVERLRASLGDGPDAQAKEITRMRVEVKILKGLLEASREACRNTQMEADVLRAEVEREKARADKAEEELVEVWNVLGVLKQLHGGSAKAIASLINRYNKATADRDRLAGLLRDACERIRCEDSLLGGRCNCYKCSFLETAMAALAEIGGGK